MRNPARRRLLGLALGAFALRAGAALPPPASGFTGDFDVLWRAIESDYAYFGRGHAGWRRARAAWRPRAARARSRGELIAALEGLLGHLHDDHVSLSERTERSPRLVPAETDIWASWKDGTAVVEAVRTYGDADVAGLRPGHAIARIAGMPTQRAVRDRLGEGADAAARDWALRHELAGPRTGTLQVEVREARGSRTLAIERAAAAGASGPPLIGRRMGEDRDLGYIRLKATLDDPALAGHFDASLEHLRQTRALILDLREVSGLGGHEVTRAILGRFARATAPWQLREPRHGPRLVDTVDPRPPGYRAPLVVLVDRWTAGEGEALAAGLDAVADARLVGTPMAGLRGELGSVRLPHSGLVARFPVQRALHPDGTPREQLRPDVPVNMAAPDGGPGDPILYQALKLLEKR
jgi:C-terminal processing protease CtpA/Prc